jgi:flagellar L-ring protein precursor FlgH
LSTALNVHFTARFARVAGRALWRSRTLALAMAATVAVGCSSAKSVLDVGKEPTLSPVGSGIKQPPLTPAAYSPAHPVVQPPQAPHYSTSLWNSRGADLFRDRRARRLGDILTVTISIKDKATLDNRSKRTRDASHGLGFDLAYDIDAIGAKTAGKGAGTTGLKSNTASDGKGEIERSESIDLRLAAVVSDVLPNGNLLIQGSQEVRVNYELRVLTFTGVVNIADIKADNTIPYERIAEARISYGGRGRSMEVQQPAWGHQLIDKYSPF